MSICDGLLIILDHRSLVIIVDGCNVILEEEVLLSIWNAPAIEKGVQQSTMLFSSKIKFNKVQNTCKS
jgi:hypothetical protein